MSNTFSSSHRPAVWTTVGAASAKSAFRSCSTVNYVRLHFPLCALLGFIPCRNVRSVCVTADDDLTLLSAANANAPNPSPTLCIFFSVFFFFFFFLSDCFASKILFTLKEHLRSDGHPGKHSCGECNLKFHNSVWSSVLYLFH